MLQIFESFTCNILTLASAEVMMQRLLQASEERMEDHIARTNDALIAQHVQPLRAEIAQERIERVQQGMRHEEMLEELSKRTSVLEERVQIAAQNSSVGGSSIDNNIIILWGFDKLMMSKSGVIIKVSEILLDKAGSPKILEHRVANISSVIPIEFDSIASAQAVH